MPTDINRRIIRLMYGARGSHVKAWARILVLTFVLCGSSVILSACRARVKQTPIYVDVYTEYFVPPTLTSHEREAVLRYLDKVKWVPYEVVPPGDTVDRVFTNDQPPIYIEATRWKRDGNREVAFFTVDENFEPESEVIGQETPEYQAMDKALEAFRKNTPLRRTAKYKEWKDSFDAQRQWQQSLKAHDQ